MKDFWADTLQLARSLDGRSYYQLLGVTQEATVEEVRNAFFTRARELHPDRHAREPDPERKRAALAVYARMDEAYRVLSNPAQRKAYDGALENGSLRLVGASSATAGARGSDPSNASARRFFDLGREREGAGDPKGALMQFRLALQLEPGSQNIREALARLGQPVDDAAAAPPPEFPPSATIGGTPVPPLMAPGEAFPSTPTGMFQMPQTTFNAARPTLPVAGDPRDPASGALPPSASPRLRHVTTPPAPRARAHDRLPFARPIKASCSTWGQFVTLHTKNLSQGGLFVKTPTPLEVGTLVVVRIGLPDGQMLELEATVARVVAPERADAGETPGMTPGMGLRFAELSAEKKRQIAELLAQAHAAVAPGAPPPATPPPAADSGPRLPRRLSTASDPAEGAILEDLLADLARVREARDPEVLGVPEGADGDAVRRAWLKLARRYHPDVYARFASPAIAEAVAEAMARVRRAYERMSRPRAGTERGVGVSVAPAAAAPAAPAAAADDAENEYASMEVTRGAAVRPLLENELFEDVPQDAGPPGTREISGLSDIEAAMQGRDALKQGRWGEAKTLLARALKTDPRDRYVRAAFHLAAAFEAKEAGLAEEARKHFETVLLFDKHSEEAIRELRAPREQPFKPERTNVFGRILGKK